MMRALPKGDFPLLIGWPGTLLRIALPLPGRWVVSLLPRSFPLRRVPRGLPEQRRTVVVVENATQRPEDGQATRSGVVVHACDDLGKQGFDFLSGGELCSPSSSTKFDGVQAEYEITFQAVSGPENIGRLLFAAMVFIQSSVRASRSAKQEGMLTCAGGGAQRTAGRNHR